MLHRGRFSRSQRSSLELYPTQDTTGNTRRFIRTNDPEVNDGANSWRPGSNADLKMFDGDGIFMRKLLVLVRLPVLRVRDTSAHGTRIVAERVQGRATYEEAVVSAGRTSFP
jgi:hypothetical protein